MSLYADYINECGIFKIIEHFWGFITYEIIGEELWSGDAYVKPEFRKLGHIDELVNQMFEAGLAAGCTVFRARIARKSDTAIPALLSHTRRGCTLIATTDEFYIVEKPLNEESLYASTKRERPEGN